MVDVIQFPGGRGQGSTGGPEDPILEQRVARLEEKVDSIGSTVKSIEAKLNIVAESVAEIKGKVSQSPTWLQLIVALIATWGAGAAIVATLLRFTLK